MWFIYVALLVLFIYILDQVLLDKRLLELGEKFNGPKRWPIIGNANLFFGVGPKGENIFKKSKSKTFYIVFIDKIKLIKLNINETVISAALKLRFYLVRILLLNSLRFYL